MYVSQCCTEHTTSSAWSAGQHCYRLNILHCMWYCRSSLLRCDNWWIDLDEHIHSRVNQSITTYCKTFQPRRPLPRGYWGTPSTLGTLPHWNTLSHTGAHPPTLGHTFLHTWGHIQVSCHILREEGVLANRMEIRKFLQKRKETNNIERRPGSGRPAKTMAAMKALI